MDWKSVLIFSILVILADPSVAKKHFAPEDLMIKEFGTTPATLRKEQVQEDIQFLIYALSKGYGGRSHVPAQTFEMVLEKIKQIDSAKTPEELMIQIDEVLLMIPDNHLRAALDGKRSPGRLKIWSANGNVGKNAIGKAKRKWDVRSELIKGQRVLYISVTSFPLRKDPIWNGFHEQVKRRLKFSKSVILDFRGNSGGDDSAGWELARIFFGRDFRVPYARQYKSRTPETLMIAANAPRLFKLNDQFKGRKPSPYLDDLLQEMMTEYRSAIQGKTPEEQIREYENRADLEKQPVAYQKPIYILMDRECGSSCESTIDFFEFHPFVKRVGENTGGFIHFGNVGYVILPNSRIDVQIPTHYNEYYDKRFVERVGIKPDIKVPSGVDAYQYLKENLLK